MWFDTHFHISPEIADRADAIISGGIEAGVTLQLIQSTSMEDCACTIGIAEAHEGVYATAGLHPHVADSPYDMHFIRDFLSHPKVKAVGEIGLDYFYDFSSRENQRKLFGESLDLAVEVNRPVVIHSREAFADTFAMVQDHLPAAFPIEIHSFTGTVDEALQWLSLGVMMSVNGMVTFKKSDNVRQILASIPMERLLLETDSPYLSPVPLRGKENTPATIPIIGARVAEEKHLEVSEVAKITTANGRRFFAI